MPQLNNNQYASLAGEEYNEENDTKIIGVDSDNKSTGVKSESGITGATGEADKMALIEETIAKEERDIAEGTDVIAGTETEDTQNKNVIHPDLQVPTVGHT